jgi:hypothetical protein
MVPRYGNLQYVQIGMDTMIPNTARVDTVEVGLGRLAMLYHSLL